MSTTSTTEQSISAKRQTYLKHLLTQAVEASDASGLGLKKLREEAIAQVSDRSFPHGKTEEWRFTDLSEMLSLPFQSASTAPVDNKLSAHLTLLEDGYRLATINGHYDESISVKGRAVAAPKLPEGAVIAPLSKLIAHPDYGDRVARIVSERLAKVEGSEEVFTALNTAGFSDVMVIWIRADQVIEQPIHIARGSEGDGIAHLRSLIIAEPNAKFTLIESFWGDAEQTRCNTSVTEFLIAQGAQVTHVRLQDEGAQTFHIGKTAVSQAADSRYHCTSLDLGGKLSRHHHEIYQQGPQTDTHLYGLSALSDRQLADTHSLIALTHPHGSATQVQKNVVDDQAHSVFNGRVYVAREAQFTNAAQLNRNLMISSKARIDTKPELDIVADNVKCAHGATVSQLQADEVFYLQSRGIDAAQAQRLLLYGFAMEIVEKITVAPLRQSLSDRVAQWAR